MPLNASGGADLAGGGADPPAPHLPADTETGMPDRKKEKYLKFKGKTEQEHARLVCAPAPNAFQNWQIS